MNRRKRRHARRRRARAAVERRNLAHRLEMGRRGFQLFSEQDIAELTWLLVPAGR
jgi:hypothetical protein